MPPISGTFSGTVNWQSAVTMSHSPDHVLGLSQVSGPQKCEDPLWADVRIVYWGTADLINGAGTQRGYWVNEHADGDKDWGSFEGQIVTSGEQTIMEGTWSYTGGSGKFANIRGGGTYKGHLPSPTQIENTWQGQYEL